MKTAKDLKIPFTWPERRPIFLDRFFYIPGHYESHQGPFAWSDLFANENPIIVEYCSGNGQWIGERAKQNPHINWVAVEKKFERARLIWLKLHRENIPNLYVVCGTAETFTKFYPPPESVSEVFVNFPDPWPKLRHAKNRIIKVPFLTELLRIVKLQGKITLVTDDPPCASLMLQALQKVPAWQPLFPDPYYLTEWADYGNSYFADLWRKKGRTIHYIPFVKAL